MSMSRKSVAALVACAATVAPLGAQAQQPAEEEASGLLTEIVVTAQRRQEKVQDVPIAISAFTADQLQSLNVVEALGVSKLIPNLLAFNNTGLGTANGYFLRGIGNTESIATFDPPVGTYADDVFISRQNANNFGLFDVDRIEVLRGPQGTLFGRNTTGGAVNIILRKPEEELGGFLEAGFGQFGAQQLRASIDLPVSDRFLTKLSGYFLEDDGIVSNPITGENDLNATKGLGLRAAARWLVSDDVTWDVSVQYIEDEGLNILNFASGGGGTAYRGNVIANGLVPIPATGPQVELAPQRPGLPPTSVAAQSIEARCAGTITRSRFSCTGLRQTGTPLANLTVGDKRNYNLGNEVENLLVTSNVQWSTGIGDVEFITGYVDLSQKFAIDFFNGTVVNPAVGPMAASNPAGGFTITNDGVHEQFSQEIKLTGEVGDNARFVAGVFYFDEDNDTDFADLFSLSSTLTVPLEDRILRNSATAWAAYTQWDLTFASDWTLTLGGRYTDETKEIAIDANANPLMAAPTAATRVNTANMRAAGIPLELNTGLFTPRVAIKYDVNEDVNLFASATRGFKSGGWNARGTAPSANQAFEPEKVWSYEAGIRSEWLDRRLRVNLTAFLLDVTDLQTGAAFQAAPGAPITFITRNFAGLENSGLEAEVIWSPVDELTLFAFGGMQNAKYKDINPLIVAQQASCRASIAGTGGRPQDCNAGIVNPAGNFAEPVRAPDTLTLGGSYAFRLGEKLTLTPNVMWAWTGDHNVATSGPPPGIVDSYATLDAGITLANADAGWQVQAICNNCTDELQVVSVLSDLPYVQAPRTWSLLFRYNFGARR
ncbi:MAG: TonB-dependent receptor [Steroidobacteraceae bacterium]|jgi:iron complex outermembrane receptor protein|nr:TonB-dependent receptor [Steroidobacteraceae bacterium]